MENMLKSLKENIDDDCNYMILCNQLQQEINKKFEPKKIKFCIEWK